MNEEEAAYAVLECLYRIAVGCDCIVVHVLRHEEKSPLKVWVLPIRVSGSTMNNVQVNTALSRRLALSPYRTLG